MIFGKPEILILILFMLGLAFLLALIFGDIIMESITDSFDDGLLPVLIAGVGVILYIPFMSYSIKSYDPPELREYIQEEIYPDQAVEIERKYGPIGKDGIDYVVADGTDIFKVTVSREEFHGKRPHKIDSLN